MWRWCYVTHILLSFHNSISQDKPWKLDLLFLRCTIEMNFTLPLCLETGHKKVFDSAYLMADHRTHFTKDASHRNQEESGQMGPPRSMSSLHTLSNHISIQLSTFPPCLWKDRDRELQDTRTYESKERDILCLLTYTLLSSALHLHWKNLVYTGTSSPSKAMDGCWLASAGESSPVCCTFNPWNLSYHQVNDLSIALEDTHMVHTAELMAGW